MFRIIGQWVIYSSKNPQNIALTIKGLIPLLVLVGVDEATSTNLVGTLGDTIIHTAQFVTLVMTLWGLLRKVVLTIKK